MSFQATVACHRNKSSSLVLTEIPVRDDIVRSNGGADQLLALCFLHGRIISLAQLRLIGQ